MKKQTYLYRRKLKKTVDLKPRERERERGWGEKGRGRGWGG